MAASVTLFVHSPIGPTTTILALTVSACPHRAPFGVAHWSHGDCCDRFRRAAPPTTRVRRATGPARARPRVRASDAADAEHLREFVTHPPRCRGLRRAAHRGQRRDPAAGRARRRVDPPPGAVASSGRTTSPTSTRSRRTTPRSSASRSGCATTTAARRTSNPSADPCVSGAAECVFVPTRARRSVTSARRGASSCADPRAPARAAWSSRAAMRAQADGLALLIDADNASDAPADRRSSTSRRRIGRVTARAPASATGLLLTSSGWQEPLSGHRGRAAGRRAHGGQERVEHRARSSRRSAPSVRALWASPSSRASFRLHAAGDLPA